jgi:hypothetical protein
MSILLTQIPLLSLHAALEFGKGKLLFFPFSELEQQFQTNGLVVVSGICKIE